MATFDYLKEQLTEFVKQFKNAKASYEYDELANLHTIEILPQAVLIVKNSQIGSVIF